MLIYGSVTICENKVIQSHHYLYNVRAFWPHEYLIFATCISQTHHLAPTSQNNSKKLMFLRERITVTPKTRIKLKPSKFSNLCFGQFRAEDHPTKSLGITSPRMQKMIEKSLQEPLITHR